MQTHYPVIVIGGGQAGLSISYCLKERGLDHLIFEKHRIAHSWRTKRWDTFCLVTPNWQCTLPGFPYPGHDPQGFMQKDDIVAYVENYARSFDAPVREGVEVTGLCKIDEQHFEVTTSIGTFTAHQVVVATGSYHQPKIPRLAERLPNRILQIHSSEYKNSQSLPKQPVLVVGTGQSGCQIAEDLHLSGQQVHLCVGGAPRSPRRYRGKDVVDWLDQMGYYDMPIDEHPQKETVRHRTNHYVTGRDGGREIDLRQFAQEGMQLHGRLRGIDKGKMEFAADLQHNLDQADAVATSIKRTIDDFIAKRHIEAPPETDREPVWQPQNLPLGLDTKHIGTVIWCTGYESNFGWVKVPVFDGKGYPGHERGITPVHGLYFLGLPWLYTWGSGRFSGIARDAIHIADYISSRQNVLELRSHPDLNEVAIGS